MAWEALMMTLRNLLQQAGSPWTLCGETVPGRTSTPAFSISLRPGEGGFNASSAYRAGCGGFRAGEGGEAPADSRSCAVEVSTARTKRCTRPRCQWLRHLGGCHIPADVMTRGRHGRQLPPAQSLEASPSSGRVS